MSVRVEILYFAGLRDAAGIASEQLDTDEARLALPFPQRQLRVAVDGEFAGWGEAVRAGSTVAFIPPVSGG